MKSRVNSFWVITLFLSCMMIGCVRHNDVKKDYSFNNCIDHNNINRQYEFFINSSTSVYNCEISTFSLIDNIDRSRNNDYLWEHSVMNDIEVAEKIDNEKLLNYCNALEEVNKTYKEENERFNLY